MRPRRSLSASGSETPDVDGTVVVAYDRPASGDDAVSFGFVVDGVGADRGAPPEDLLVALGVVDGVVGGVDGDAGDVVAVDGVELPVDEGGGGLAEAVEQVLEVLAPQVVVASLASLGEGGVVVFEAVDRRRRR